MVRIARFHRAGPGSIPGERIAPIAQFGQSVSLMNRRSWVRAPLGTLLPRWLNWIERMTSNHKVVGSSPTRGIQVQYCLIKY